MCNQTTNVEAGTGCPVFQQQSSLLLRCSMLQLWPIVDGCACWDLHVLTYPVLASKRSVTIYGEIGYIPGTFT